MKIITQVLIVICALLFTNLASAQSPTADQGTQPTKQDAIKILFIGNSHLLVKNVPVQVRGILLKTHRGISIRSMAVGGARLSHFAGRSDVAAALKTTKWDVVVLQEASVSFLTAQGRSTFHKSVNWFIRQLRPETRVVLYQTWPWRTGSGFYGARQFNEKTMWAAMRNEYQKIAQRKRLVIAPVGRCWVQSPRKAAYYSSDGNHASSAGARFAARVLAKSIAKIIADGQQVDC
ncbi:MAG: SGNH/GDSL hydrolase family protein [Pseudomonadota bacterium]